MKWPPHNEDNCQAEYLMDHLKTYIRIAQVLFITTVIVSTLVAAVLA